MAEVKWNARRLTDGVMVDVTADIDGMAQPVPVENAIEGGGGGEQTIRLLGPFRVNFNTAGFVNPADNGIATLDIPAGALVVKTIPLVVTDPVGSESGDTLYLSLLAAANGSGPLLGAWDVFNSAITDNNVGTGEMKAYSVDEPETGEAFLVSTYGPRSAFAVAEASVYANLSANGTITAGAWDIYALIAEPAS